MKDMDKITRYWPLPESTHQVLEDYFGRRFEASEIVLQRRDTSGRHIYRLRFLLVDAHRLEVSSDHKASEASLDEFNGHLSETLREQAFKEKKYLKVKIEG